MLVGATSAAGPPASCRVLPESPTRAARGAVESQGGSCQGSAQNRSVMHLGGSLSPWWRPGSAPVARACLSLSAAVSLTRLRPHQLLAGPRPDWARLALGLEHWPLPLPATLPTETSRAPLLPLSSLLSDVTFAMPILLSTLSSPRRLYLKQVQGGMTDTGTFTPLKLLTNVCNRYSHHQSQGIQRSASPRSPLTPLTGNAFPDPGPGQRLSSFLLHRFALAGESMGSFMQPLCLAAVTPQNASETHPCCCVCRFVCGVPGHGWATVRSPFHR